MNGSLRVAAVLLAAGIGAAGQNGQGTLQFSMDRKGPPTMQYTVAVDETTGVGIYLPRVEEASVPVSLVSLPDGGKPLRLSGPVLRKLLGSLPALRAGHCETKIKGIAQTGSKTLRESGATCTYNFSDDEKLNEATSTFEAIAETLQFGDRLAAKHRFDRLGLDAEIDNLVHALAEGRALEVGNIAPVLQSITDDERVMERVRRKTAHLLEGTASAQARLDVSER